MPASSRVISLKPRMAEDKSFLLSKNGVFLFSFCNGAFGSKWCGLWKGRTKYLEYLAFRVNGEWLSPENFRGIRYDGVVAELSYAPARVELAVSGNGLVARVSTKKPSEVEMEPGVNIRRRDENLHGRNYRLLKRGGVLVRNSLGQVWIRGGEFVRDERREKHFPGKYAIDRGYDWEEGEQEKYVPGRFHARGKEVEFRFELGGEVGGLEQVVREGRKFVAQKARSSNWKYAAAVSHFFTGDGFFAGFPYFNEFWTRDFLWMVEPLIENGWEEEVRRSLKAIGESQLRDGSIPSVAGGRACSADSTPLWALACLRLFEERGDREELRVLAAIDHGLSRMEGGMINHPPECTWMDTVKRKFAIEVQSLWAEVFDLAGEHLDSDRLLDASAEIWETVEESLLHREVLADALSSPYRFTANSLVPVMFRQVSLGQKRLILKRARDELLTRWGVKAVSRLESSQPEKYHERVWGLTTYWGTRAFDGDLRRKILENFLRSYGSRTLFGLPETISEGKPLGASHQLWSIAFLGREVG